MTYADLTHKIIGARQLKFTANIFWWNTESF
jgi:hypothetical protein